MEIIDPETGVPIYLYSDRVNELLKKYEEKDILALKITTPLQYNRNTVFIDDILYTIMLNLDFQDIKSLCETDKNANQICDRQDFWEFLLKRDNLYFEGVEKSLKSYDLLVHLKLKIEKLDIGKLGRKTMVFIFNMDLRKILSEEELDKVTKQYEKDHENDENINYIIEEFSIYQGYHPLQNILGISFSDGSVEEITINTHKLKNVLLKTLYYYPNVVINTY